jgi:hypothetical protein
VQARRRTCARGDASCGARTPSSCGNSSAHCGRSGGSAVAGPGPAAPRSARPSSPPDGRPHPRGPRAGERPARAGGGPRRGAARRWSGRRGTGVPCLRQCATPRPKRSEGASGRSVATLARPPVSC